ncbi:MAG: AAA family ATPase [Bacteroidota bacterium]
MIIAITGASGVGKTSIMKALSETLSEDNGLKFFYFDDMEMPNWDEVADTKKWQENATNDWIDQLVEIARREKVNIIFEGSTEIKFYIQAFERNSFSDYKLFLFDCSPTTMKQRLSKRGQPELYSENMLGWLNYLRREAEVRDIEIIKTDELSIAEVGQKVSALLY